MVVPCTERPIILENVQQDQWKWKHQVIFIEESYLFQCSPLFWFKCNSGTGAHLIFYGKATNIATVCHQWFLAEISMLALDFLTMTPSNTPSLCVQITAKVLRRVAPSFCRASSIISKATSQNRDPCAMAEDSDGYIWLAAGGSPAAAAGKGGGGLGQSYVKTSWSGLSSQNWSAWTRNEIKPAQKLKVAFCSHQL